jgi:hypothetical protein
MLLLCLLQTHAQSSSIFSGARANGLGFASSCLEDEWSIFNNIAGLAKVDQVSAAFTYDAQPSFKPFNKAAAIFAMPLKFGVAGVGIFHFGDKLYNEQILTAGFSNTFGLASLGIKVNYIQYYADGFGRKGVISISFGGIARLTENLSLGAHIVNLNQPTISTSENEKLPTTLVIGVGFKLSSKTYLTTEIEKDFDYAATWKTGFEYQLNKKFTFRTAFNVNPHAGFFGFGFRPRKFKLDYAYQHHFTFGARHQATVGYIFNRTSNESSSR